SARAARSPPLRYTAGRARCTATLSHSVTAPFQEIASASTVMSPRARAGDTWPIAATTVPPARDQKATLLAVRAVAELWTTAQRSIPGSVAGSQGGVGAHVTAAGDAAR